MKRRGSRHIPNPRKLPALLGMILLVFGLGCSERAPEQEVETVDIAPGIEVDTSSDETAKSPEPALVGILPGDFPSDLPVYLPASLVDFGETENGRSTISLLSPHPIGRVRSRIYAELRSKGWSQAAGSNGALVLRKNRREVLLYLEEGRPGTRYRFVY